MSPFSSLFFNQERAIVLGSLLVVTAMSWFYLLLGAGMDMTASGSMDQITMRASWSLSYAALMFLMWCIMMVAMMLPSATPMILLFTELNRKLSRGHSTAILSFVLAYIIVWGIFSFVATGLQWWLDGIGLLAMMEPSTNLLLGGVLLVAAGSWQLTPFKDACLRHCRTPIQYLAENWQSGIKGAFRMGAVHGAYCLGCCWVLMALLFYGGVMNLWWIIGLTLYVLAEKVIPSGLLIGRFTGVILITWGGYFIYESLLH